MRFPYNTSVFLLTVSDILNSGLLLGVFLDCGISTFTQGKDVKLDKNKNIFVCQKGHLEEESVFDASGPEICKHC